MRRLAYLSPVPYASFAQRPHHFVAWFHECTRGEVLWVDPYPTRLPALADWRRVGGGVAPPTSPVVPDWLRVIAPRALPIEPLPWSGRVNRRFWRPALAAIVNFLARGDALVCIGKPSEFALDVLRLAGDTPAIYDVMDDFPAFYAGLSQASMIRRETALLAQVSRVLVSSSALARRFAARGIGTTLALNACASAALPPVAQLPARPASDIIGYVGTLGAWFDWPLVIAIAESNPRAEVRLIGPVFVSPPGDLPRNVALLPACDHAAAMDAMSGFSVGLIPFLLTPLTASVDPIKYYEYRALGLPVVSTRFGEMSVRGPGDGVQIVAAGDELSNLVARTRRLAPAADDIAAFRRGNSWEARFDAAGIVS